ncbi:MAG: hypothetical protein GY913_30355, partial [Proteobacteria bacterium]|nr:hypothetical protein [Pseudomonadota bacterium]
SDVNPGATEVCNGLDDDCDAGTSEDGFAAFDDGSTVTDYTSTLGAGTASTPADVTLSTDGTMSLCDGTYYVNFDVEADVDFAGVSGDETAVILDGAATGTVVAIETAGVAVSLSDLTIQDGDADVLAYFSSTESGGAIACVGASTVSAENVVLDSNSAEVGGAIGLEECAGTFTNVTVSNNSSDSSAGAIALTDASAEFYDSFIEGNSAGLYGGAFYVVYSATGSDLYFEDTEVTDNTASSGIDVGLIHNDSTVDCVGDTASSGLGFTGHGDAKLRRHLRVLQRRRVHGDGLRLRRRLRHLLVG